MPAKFTVVIEDDGMDSGCIHDILETCANHGKVLEARISGIVEHGPDIGQHYDNNIMYHITDNGIVNDGSKMGKC